MRQQITRLSSVLALTLLMGGCAAQHTPIDPGKINHVVLFNLKDASMTTELMEDCDTHLKSIPAVRTYACGPHFEMGRQNINSDYMLGLLVSFDDEAGYKAYLEHPGHVTLVEKWRPEFSNVTIYDITNGTQEE